MKNTKKRNSITTARKWRPDERWETCDLRPRAETRATRCLVPLPPPLANSPLRPPLAREARDGWGGKEGREVAAGQHGWDVPPPPPPPPRHTPAQPEHPATMHPSPCGACLVSPDARRALAARADPPPSHGARVGAAARVLHGAFVFVMLPACSFCRRWPLSGPARTPHHPPFLMICKCHVQRKTLTSTLTLTTAGGNPRPWHSSWSKVADARAESPAGFEPDQCAVLVPPVGPSSGWIKLYPRWPYSTQFGCRVLLHSPCRRPSARPAQEATLEPNRAQSDHHHHRAAASEVATPRRLGAAPAESLRKRMVEFKVSL